MSSPTAVVQYSHRTCQALEQRLISRSPDKGNACRLLFHFTAKRGRPRLMARHGLNSALAALEIRTHAPGRYSSCGYLDLAVPRLICQAFPPQGTVIGAHRGRHETVRFEVGSIVPSAKFSGWCVLAMTTSGNYSTVESTATGTYQLHRPPAPRPPPWNQPAPCAKQRSISLPFSACVAFDESRPAHTHGRNVLQTHTQTLMVQTGEILQTFFDSPHREKGAL